MKSYGETFKYQKVQEQVEELIQEGGLPVSGFWYWLNSIIDTFFFIYWQFKFGKQKRDILTNVSKWKLIESDISDVYKYKHYEISILWDDVKLNALNNGFEVVKRIVPEVSLKRRTFFFNFYQKDKQFISLYLEKGTVFVPFFLTKKQGQLLTDTLQPD